MNNAKTDVNIITKQVIINTPTSAHLLPITADEKVIDKIQQALAELEELKRDVKRYFELDNNYQKSSHEYHEMEYIKTELLKVGSYNFV